MRMRDIEPAISGPSRGEYRPIAVATFMLKYQDQAIPLHRSMCADAVTDGTNDDYMRLIRRMADAAQLIRGRPVDDDFSDVIFRPQDFTLFLAAIVAECEFAGSSTAVYLTALRHYQQSERFGLEPGEPVWAFDERHDRAVNGLRYRAKDPDRQRPARGAISREMLEDLTRWCFDNKLSHVVPFIRVQWGCAARKSQVIAMTAGDANERNMEIKLRKDKTVHAQSRSLSEITYKPIDAETLGWSRSAERGCEKGELLFPVSQMGRRRAELDSRRPVRPILRRIALPAARRHARAHGRGREGDQRSNAAQGHRHEGRGDTDPLQQAGRGPQGQDHGAMEDASCGPQEVALRRVVRGDGFARFSFFLS